jgi:hypothetical protein
MSKPQNSDYSISVPILLDNKLAGVKTKVKIIGGFGGISEVIGEGYKAYKPQMSFIVFTDGEPLPKEEDTCRLQIFNY